MTMVKIAPHWAPHDLAYISNLGNATISNVIISTGSDKTTIIGPVNKTGNVAKIGFMLGTIANGVNTARFSIQGVLALSGPPPTNDGIVKGATGNGFFTSSNAGAGYAAPGPVASTWWTASLNEVVPVIEGGKIAVVMEFTGSYTSGSINFQAAPAAPTQGGDSQYANTSFLRNGVRTILLPNVILYYDDGSTDTFTGAFACKAIGQSTVFNSGTNPNFRGLEFSFPFACRIDAMAAFMDMNVSGANFDLRLYDGNTLMATASVGYSDGVRSSGTDGIFIGKFSSPQSITASHLYNAFIVPTTANSVKMWKYTVNSASEQGVNMGTGASFCEQTMSGSVLGTHTATTVPHIAVRISHIDDGTGTGGAASAVPGLLGPGRLIG